MTCGQSGVAMGNLWLLLAAGGVMAAVIGCLTLLNNRYTLNNIKSKTVGDGQHGTARWATDAEIRKAYALVPFQAASWRRGQRRRKCRGWCWAASAISVASPHWWIRTMCIAL